MRTYENETPITDARQVLELLSTKLGRWVGAYLNDGYYNGEACVEVIWEGREYSGNSSQYFLVDKTCVEKMREMYWLSGMPRSGYTDQHRLILSNRGLNQLREWEAQDRKEAHDLLIPGEHGWSSIFNYRGMRLLRRGEPHEWKEGYLFENPAEKYFLVLLKEKKVIAVTEDCEPM